MKKILIFSLLFAGLAACSTAPKGFGPAYGSDFGYKNTKIEQDRFRISYTSSDVNQSRDYALLRAAQIAKDEGYSHFKVVGGGTSGNQPRARIGSSFGIGIGSGYRGRSRTSTYLNIGVEDLVRALEGDKITENIEVILLRSAGKEDPSVFEAEGVLKNILPPVVQQAKLP